MQNVNTLCIAAQSPQDTHSTYGIVQRTESDRMANGIRLDGGRNPIGWRPQSDWVADGIWQGVQLSQLHQQSKQRECPTEHAEHAEPSNEIYPPTDDTVIHRLGARTQIL